MTRFTRIALLSPLAVVASFAFATSPEAQLPAEDGTVVRDGLGRDLDLAVQRSGGGDFWGAVLVGRGGEVLLARGYGFADYADTPNTPRTLFELASASKQLTAAAVLHLEQRGDLRVTDALEGVFEDVPDNKRGITIYQLLTHTSGISGRIGVPYSSPIHRGAYVRAMLAEPLSSRPGSRYEYSNVGYALLAAVVEVIAEEPFEDYVERNLLGPADLRDTGFIGDRDLIHTERASSRRTGEPGPWTAAAWHWGWGYRGMGGVVTTVLDLWTWDRALRTDEILGAEAKRTLYAPALDGYACGWRVDVTERATRRVHHSGGVAGYGTNVVRFLEDDVCVFVLSNDGGAAHRVTAALEALLFEPAALEVTIDASPYDLGTRRIVQLPEGLAWRAHAKDDRLAIRLVDGEHVVVETRAPRAYAVKLAVQLRQAIAAREPSDAGGPAAIEAGLYLQSFDHSLSKITVSEGLVAEVRPEYRGVDRDRKPVIDERALFLVRNDWGWPVMAKMNVAAARELLEEIEAAAR